MSSPSRRLSLYRLRAQGELACYKTKNIKVGDSSCHGKGSCETVFDSTIDNDSCHVKKSCWFLENSTIHKGSCQGENTCSFVQNSIIGEGSCNGGSDKKDNGSSSCSYSKNVTIGNNSCNQLDGSAKYVICYKCHHNVPDNACNQGSTDDLTEDGYCKFCGENPTSG